MSVRGEIEVSEKCAEKRGCLGMCRFCCAVRQTSNDVLFSRKEGFLERFCGTEEWGGFAKIRTHTHCPVTQNSCNLYPHHETVC